MNIFNFLDKKYPQEKSEEWDPVGFSFHFHDNVKKVLICLDLTKEALNFAIKNQIDTIITHHPFIFSASLTKEYQIAPYKMAMIPKIRKQQINVFALHTNFDANNKGTAYNILKQLRLKNSSYQKLDKYNLIVNHPILIKTLLTKLAKLDLYNFNASYNLNQIINQKINNFAILPGSGGIEAIIKAKKAQVNLIITSDLKWNEWITINSFTKKIPIVLEVSHLIESVFIIAIQKSLQKKFPKLEILTWKNQELKFAFQTKGVNHD